jgi:HK97 family phage major capsid protein
MSDIIIDYDKIASKVANEIKSDLMSSLKTDVMNEILNDPIALKNGVVSPDGGSADKEVKNFADFTAAVLRNDAKRLSSIYEVKAQYESDGKFGGYAVPPQFAGMIDGYAIEESIIRKGATVIPTTLAEYKAPRIDQTIAPDGSSAMLGGIKLYWTAERGNIQQTTMKMDMIDLKVNKMGAYVQISEELLADAQALSGLLIQKFGEAKGWFEDYAFLNGNGVGKPLGILNAPATYSVSRNTASHFKLEDAQNMVSRLPSASRGRAVFVMHQSVMPDLMNLATSGNFVTFLRDLQGRPETRLLGIPVEYTEKIPVLGTAGDVLLIDRSAYYILNRKDTTIATSNEVAFLTDEVVMKVTSRLDGQPALNDKITLADGSYQVSPFVKLS